MFAMESLSMPKGDGRGHGLKGEQEELSETQKEDLTKNTVRDH